MFDFPQRKPNRLKGYKYNQNGSYFITICVQNRMNLLCKIVGDGFSVPNKIHLYKRGGIAQQFIVDLSTKYPYAKVDKYVIMPNHVHLLLSIDNQMNDMGNITETPSPTVGAIIGWYKYQTTKQMNNPMDNETFKIWQRSFHDHIIRNDEEYQEIWDYINTNPQRWKDDCFYHHDITETDEL